VWQQRREEVAGLVEDKAALNAPPSMPFDQRQRVVLVIADPQMLKADIDALPKIDPSPSTQTVAAGPEMKAWLNVDPAEADVSANQPPEQTDFNNNFQWSWTVHTKKPIDALGISAEVQVVLADGTALKPVEFPTPIFRSLAHGPPRLTSGGPSGGTRCWGFSWVWRPSAVLLLRI
jgi:hypothetical protein